MRTIKVIEDEIRIMQGWYDNALADLLDAQARLEVTRRTLDGLQAELAAMREAEEGR